MCVGELSDELFFVFFTVVIDGALVSCNDSESHLSDLEFEAFADSKVQCAVVKHFIGPFPEGVQLGMDVAGNVWPCEAVEVLNGVTG